jgi:hypothetical protein
MSSKQLRRPTVMERYAQQQIRDSLEYSLNPTQGERLAQAALRCCAGEDRESLSRIHEESRRYVSEGKKGIASNG